MVSDTRSNDNREVSCIFDSLLNSPWGYLGVNDTIEQSQILIQSKLLNYVHCDLYCALLHKYFIFIYYGGVDIVKLAIVSNNLP